MTSSSASRLRPLLQHVHGNGIAARQLRFVINTRNACPPSPDSSFSSSLSAVYPMQLAIMEPNLFITGYFRRNFTFQGLLAGTPALPVCRSHSACSLSESCRMVKCGMVLGYGTVRCGVVCMRWCAGVHPPDPQVDWTVVNYQSFVLRFDFINGIGQSVSLSSTALFLPSARVCVGLATARAVLLC